MWTVFSPCSALDMLLMLFVFSSYVGIVWLYVGHVILFFLLALGKRIHVAINFS